MQHRQNRPRAIAVAAPAPYAGPGHLVVIAALIALALLFFSNLPHAHAGFFGGPEEVRAQSGTVKIPVADVSDGKAHFYRFKTGGKTVEFFVIKSRDGVVRTALNACDVCFPAKKGYTQQGDNMVCNNCGQKFNSARVMDVKGGCNPSPLPRTLDGKNVVIREADLAAGVKYF
jgi:Predicted membrane protein